MSSRVGLINFFTQLFPDRAGKGWFSYERKSFGAKTDVIWAFSDNFGQWVVKILLGHSQSIEKIQAAHASGEDTPWITFFTGQVMLTAVVDLLQKNSLFWRMHCALSDIKTHKINPSKFKTSLTMLRVLYVTLLVLPVIDVLWFGLLVAVKLTQVLPKLLALGSAMAAEFFHALASKFWEISDNRLIKFILLVVVLPLMLLALAFHLARATLLQIFQPIEQAETIRKDVGTFLFDMKWFSEKSLWPNRIANACGVMSLAVSGTLIAATLFTPVGIFIGVKVIANQWSSVLHLTKLFNILNTVTPISYIPGVSKPMEMLTNALGSHPSSEVLLSSTAVALRALPTITQNVVISIIKPIQASAPEELVEVSESLAEGPDLGIPSAESIHRGIVYL